MRPVYAAIAKEPPAGRQVDSDESGMGVIAVGSCLTMTWRPSGAWFISRNDNYKQDAPLALTRYARAGVTPRITERHWANAALRRSAREGPVRRLLARAPSERPVYSLTTKKRIKLRSVMSRWSFLSLSKTLAAVGFETILSTNNDL